MYRLSRLITAYGILHRRNGYDKVAIRSQLVTRDTTKKLLVVSFTMAMAGIEPQLLGKNLIKSVVTGESVAVETLWENQACVITFLRRFGCPFCRVGARQLSDMKPLLDAHDVRLVAVGFEDIGLDEFVSGKYFTGDLFLDEKRECYKSLAFTRASKLSLISAVFGKAGRDLYNKAKKDGLGGDLKGDGFQRGGTVVVSKGGNEFLLMYQQNQLADHVDPNNILKSLGIQEKANVTQESATCSSEDKCSL